MATRKDTAHNANQLPEDEIINRYVASLDEKDRAAIKSRHKRRKRMYKGRGHALLFVGIGVALLAVLGGLLYFTGVLSPLAKSVRAALSPAHAIVQSSVPANQTESAADGTADTSNTGSTDKTANRPERPSKIFAFSMQSGREYQPATAEKDIAATLNEAAGNGFTTVFFDLNAQSGLITDSAEGKALISGTVAAAHEKAISVFGVLDVTALGGNLTEPAALTALCDKLSSLSKDGGLDGLMLSGMENQTVATGFKDYIRLGCLTGYKSYCENRLTGIVQSLSKAVRETNDRLLLGMICDSVYATTAYKQDGMAIKAGQELLRDKHANVLQWMENCFDIAFIKADTTTASTDMPFETVANWWHKNTPASCDLGFILSSDKAMQGEGQWKNPDQLARQLRVLNDMNRYVFCFNDYAALRKDQSGGAKLIYKYLSSGIDNQYILTNLTFTTPTKRSFTTYENSISIVGASDPNFDLTMNGKAVDRTEFGYFSLQLDLKIGKNTFTFAHKGTEETFTINYRYVVLKEYSPSTALSLDGGSTLIVRAVARTGSTVQATLNGSTVKLERTEGPDDSAFSTYMGSFVLPDGLSANKSIGNVVFKGTYNGISESFTGGKVTVKKTVTYTPGSGNYIGVGNSLIAEIAKFEVETFDGDKVDDLSQPYNSYLPLGTLDYCSEKTQYDPDSQNTYRTLRYGKRVYTTHKGVANIKTYRGSLPGSNKLSVKSINTDNGHTKLTLKTEWKAPFKVLLSPQKYSSSTGSQRGAITKATFTYVDITFCYASAFTGSLDAFSDNPVFSKAQLIKNTSDYTLRLYLKKTGAFYGWAVNYDKSGNLVFSFLNPKTAQKASNAYGGTLNGITVVVDAGHGGSDGGAAGTTLDEAELSLRLAKKVESRLKSIGAKVVMTRTSDVSITPDDRTLRVKNATPDLAVSVHRNASINSKARGFCSYHFNAFTRFPAEKINTRMAQKGTYTQTGVQWHYFYLSRISDCPVVLTENGYMSNTADYQNMLNDGWNDKCADAIVTGIVDYFLSIG